MRREKKREKKTLDAHLQTLNIRMIIEKVDEYLVAGQFDAI